MRLLMPRLAFAAFLVAVAAGAAEAGCGRPKIKIKAKGCAPAAVAYAPAYGCAPVATVVARPVVVVVPAAPMLLAPAVGRGCR